uniref:Uncharacterized protein n=1 Tax=Suricata suricatta TaxID=37032 RepID=A0A673T6K9_SURSU
MRDKCAGLGKVLSRTALFLPHLSFSSDFLFDFSCLVLRLEPAEACGQEDIRHVLEESFFSLLYVPKSHFIYLTWNYLILKSW